MILPKRVILETPTIHTGKLRKSGWIMFNQFIPSFWVLVSVMSKSFLRRLLSIIKGIWFYLKWVIAVLSIIMLIIFVGSMTPTSTMMTPIVFMVIIVVLIPCLWFGVLYYWMTASSDWDKLI